MKKIISIMLIAFTITAIMPNITSFATSSSKLSVTYYSELGIWFDASVGTVTDCDDTVTELYLPYEIDGVSVVAIEENAFAECGNLNKIILPESIIRIGYAAFYNCVNLSYILIGNYTKIDEDAFEGATNVKFYCNLNSYAAIYALEHDIPFYDLSVTVNGENLSLNYSNTNYEINKDIVSSSGYIPMILNYEFKNDANPEAMNIVINISKNAELLENSLYVNDELCTFFSEKNVLTIPVKNKTGIIVFHLNPLSYEKIESYAKISFTENGISKEEIIGTVYEELPFLTIISSKETNTKYCEVKGVTIPKNIVKLYIDGVFQKNISADENGIYSAELSLNNISNKRIYIIKAETSTNDVIIISKTRVSFRNTTPTVTKFTLEHNGKTYTSESTIIDFKSGSDFKFTIYLDNTDRIGSVYVVSTKNNAKKQLEAIWNESEQAYIAKGFFDPHNTSYIPGNISIICEGFQNELDINTPYDFNTEEIESSIPENWKESEITIDSNTDDNFDATIKISEDDGTKTSIRMTSNKKELPKDITVNNAESNGYMLVSDNNGTKVFARVYDDVEPKVDIIEFANDVAVNCIETVVSVVGNINGVNKIIDAIDYIQISGNSLFYMGEYTEIQNDIMTSPVLNAKQKETLRKKVTWCATTNTVAAIGKGFGFLVSSVAAFVGGPVGVSVLFGTIFFDATFSAVQHFAMDDMLNVMYEVQNLYFDYQITTSPHYGTYGKLTYYVNSNNTVSITACDEKAKYVTIPMNIESFPVTILAIESFYYCKELKSVSMPNTVTTIDKAAFAQCNNLKSISLPNGIKTIGDSAFSSCTNLSSITIPDSITSIGDSVFSGCTSLSNITLPNSITSIGNHVFSNCTNLSDINLSKTLSSIGHQAFSNCLSISNITIPASVNRSTGCSKHGSSSTYGDWFSGCENLKSVTFEFGAKNIPQYSLAGSSVENVIIPSTVTTIDKAAFARCDNLNSIYYYGTEEQWNKMSIKDTSTELANTTKYFVVPKIKEMIVTQSMSDMLSVYIDSEYIQEDAIIYIVSYDNNKRMLEIQTTNINNLETKLSSHNVETVQCFIWNESIQPLCNDKCVSLSDFIFE